MSILNITKSHVYQFCLVSLTLQ